MGGGSQDFVVRIPKGADTDTNASGSSLLTVNMTRLDAFEVSGFRLVASVYLRLALTMLTFSFFFSPQNFSIYVEIEVMPA